jgi:hypothetical protein
MKTHAIYWKSIVNGSTGTGTKRFEKTEADLLAAELNDSYPDIVHEAIVPPPTPVAVPDNPITAGST